MTRLRTIDNHPDARIKMGTVDCETGLVSSQGASLLFQPSITNLAYLKVVFDAFFLSQCFNKKDIERLVDV